MAPDVAEALALLAAGKLVAFPTETVYGLGADADNPDAVARIFAAKGRPADHPLIVHLASAAALPAWAREVPEAAWRLAAAFWPGPLTLILKRAARVADIVTGGQDSVGLRVPNQALALQLLAAFAGDQARGLAAPSANRFGRISPTTAEHVRSELGAAVSLVLDGGPCSVGIESTIVDLSRDQPVLLRPGAIAMAQLEAVLGQPIAVAAPGAEAQPRVSGSLAAHYAPATPLQLLAATQLAAAARAALQGGQRIAVLARRRAPARLAEGVLWHAAPVNARAYAHDLYATLRRLDVSGVDCILVEAPPAEAPWLAVLDRLQRAAAGSGASAT